MTAHISGVIPDACVRDKPDRSDPRRCAFCGSVLLGFIIIIQELEVESGQRVTLKEPEKCVIALLEGTRSVGGFFQTSGGECESGSCGIFLHCFEVE
jgi:hypothetical protein